MTQPSSTVCLHSPFAHAGPSETVSWRAPGCRLGQRGESPCARWVSPVAPAPAAAAAAAAAPVAAGGGAPAWSRLLQQQQSHTLLTQAGKEQQQQMLLPAVRPQAVPYPRSLPLCLSLLLQRMHQQSGWARWPGSEPCAPGGARGLVLLLLLWSVPCGACGARQRGERRERRRGKGGERKEGGGANGWRRRRRGAEQRQGGQQAKAGRRRTLHVPRALEA